METTRLTAKISAALLIVAALSAASPHSASAQSGPVRLTSNESTVSHNISQSIERCVSPISTAASACRQEPRRPSIRSSGKM